MFKKLGICLVAGSIAFTAAACENTKDAKKDVASTTQNHGKKDDATGQQTSYKSIFKDSLIMGDSITEGLTYHEFLDKQNVMAKTGNTLMFVLNDKDDEEAIKRKPKHIFMAYGNDDLYIKQDMNQKPVNDPVQFAMDNYKKIIGKMKKELPDTKLHVLAIVPVTAEAEQTTPQYKKIKEFNEALKKLAETESIDYIDLSSLVKEHQDLYDKDGVHFKKEFYPLMLEELKPKLQ